MARKRPSLHQITDVIEEIREPHDDVAAAHPTPEVVDTGVDPHAAPTKDTPEEEDAGPPEDGVTIDPQEYWRKSTIPFRRDQLEALEELIAQLARQKRVRVSKAELLRLALDRLLEDFQEEVDAVLYDVYLQEQREEADVPSRKYARSRGLINYLKRTGFL